MYDLSAAVYRADVTRALVVFDHYDVAGFYGHAVQRGHDTGGDELVHAAFVEGVVGLLGAFPEDLAQGAVNLPGGQAVCDFFAIEAQLLQQEQIVACRKRRSGNPLQKTVRLMNEYIENLYRVDHSFLSDLRRKVIFAEHYDEQREFWHKELVLHLDNCRKQELLLPEIDATAFADQLIGALFDLRLNGASQEEVSLFCRTILRGAATRQGIELIDRRP